MKPGLRRLVMAGFIRRGKLVCKPKKVRRVKG
jgi:hypothetical protein